MIEDEFKMTSQQLRLEVLERLLYSPVRLILNKSNE